MDDDFLVPLDISIAGKATDKAVNLLRVGGVEKLTLNTLAKAALYAPGHFHARVGGRAGMIEMLVSGFADRWQRRITDPRWIGDGLAWLPGDPGAVHGVRCWHAMVELAYGEACAGRPGAAETLAALDRREQYYLHAALATHLGRRPAADELLLVQLALRGLRAAMAAPVDPLPWDPARSVLRRLLRALEGMGPADRSGTEPNE